MSGARAKPSGDSRAKFKPPPNLKKSQKSVFRTPTKPPRQAIKSPAEIKKESQTLPIEEIMRRLREQKEGPKADPDPFVKSSRVYGVNEIFALRRFLVKKDAAFVLFYDPTDSKSHWVKPRIAKAAEITERENHAYVAVNCLQEPSTCTIMDVHRLPALTLYARGVTVKRVKDVSGITSEQMKKFVEMSPKLPEVDYTRPLCVGRQFGCVQPTIKTPTTPFSSRLRAA